MIGNVNCGAGKIKCEATEVLACAVALLLFLFYRSDSQNGFADLAQMFVPFSFV